ncbi:serine/threonine-protein kinase [Streptomyces sp. NPDC101118]|uniref:serine/threonine-protein kinase n=1 Tax=Streptomyces sp. NPDC101118 TaxID=3366109 RepID=UPI003828F190
MEQLAFGDPQRIGGYRLLARLGAGGMGQVYLARSERGRTVAVKLVRPELAERAEFRARFRQEVAAARRVGGEWTAPVLDADTEAPVPWLATGYVAGPSLSAVVARQFGPLPERSVRILAAGLAYALQDIHAAGMVHRDLKPSNVLVTLDGPRVIDFGIARALAGDPGHTRTGELVGSPGFMAPEQVRGGAVTAACDVFCLGSLLAYAASGRLPFGEAEGAGGVAALLLRIADAEPDLTGVPEALRPLVRDCLHKDPGARPTPADVLARVGAGDTVADGRALEPWLPAALVAQLGRHAVELLEREDAGPARAEPPQGPTTRVGQPPPAADGYGYGYGPPHGPYGGPPGGYGTPPGGYGQPAGPGQPGGPAPAPGEPAGYGAPGGPGYGQGGGFGPGGGFGVACPPPPPVATERPRPGSSAFLVAVALVVAVLAGGTVFAFMNGWHGDHDRDDLKGTGPRPATASGTPDGQRTGSPSPSAATPDPTAGAGIPAGYLGTWSSELRTWRLTLRAGAVGEQVMTLVKTDPAYTCTWTATLRSAGPPVELDASAVTSGDPATCGPGPWSVLTLLPDGRLERRLTGSDKPPLTYTREG